MTVSRLLSEGAEYRHFCYVTDDIDASIASFKGLGVTGLEKLDVPSLAYAVGDISPGTRVEISGPKSEENVFGQFLAQRGPGLHHICFRVTDYDETLRLLTAAGCVTLFEASRIRSGRPSRLAIVDGEAAKLPIIEITEPT
jgi:catechol 2,3-dioxygenase-like lactoylglutathione lyase family enzyme